MRKPSDSPTPPDLTLPQLLLILRRRLSLILKVATAILVLGILVCLLSPRKYSATSTVMVQSNSANGIDRSSLIGTGPTPPDSNEADLTVQTQAKLLQSNTLALRTIRKLDLVHKSDFLQSRGLSSIFSSISSRPPLPNSSATDVKLLQIFQKSLTVKPVVGTRLLNVTFSSSNPQLSADVANELVRELGDYVSETRYKATEAASQTLTKQLADLRIQSESLQAKVAAMQAQSGLYSIGTTDAQGRQQAYSAILDQFQRAALTLNEASQKSSVEAGYLRLGKKRQCRNDFKSGRQFSWWHCRFRHHQLVINHPATSHPGSDIARATGSIEGQIRTRLP